MDSVKAERSMSASRGRRPIPVPMSAKLSSTVLSSTLIDVRDLVKDLHSFCQPVNTTKATWAWGPIDSKKNSKKRLLTRDIYTFWP